MKTTASFRISKQTKRFMASFIDAHARGEYKRAMIQAELAAAVRPKERKKGEPDLAD